ncbi:MAG TPA: hypothetical protein VK169_05000 [Saprospiraceae bacterium]|nr:hypothetical protein [Saprospiraceae bacterium]
MNLKIEIYFVTLIGFITLGCKDSIKNPIKDSNLYFNENKLALSTEDSTLELIDSCLTKEYNVKLEEFINFDSNAFKLTIVKDGIEKIQILDLPPGRTNIEYCSKDLIILGSACGGPCSSKDFIFVNDDRPNEGYQYCHIAENNEKIISYHVNEEFEIIKIRNLKNGKEMSSNISPCENQISYPCGISTLKVGKNKLFITFDSPEHIPRQKEISIVEILN